MATPKTAQKNRSESPEATSDHVEERAVATSATLRSRGPVDAPGKRHRKAPPQEPIARHMGEPQGKQMGQKSAKNGRRGPRA